MMIKINPEQLEIANNYLTHELSTIDCAKELGISIQDVQDVLDKAPVKRYIDNLFMEQGYRNKHKLQKLMDRIIEVKIEECEESEVFSNKDILEILALQHKMRKEEIELAHKLASDSGTTVNIQQNIGGNNYDNLINRLLNGNKSSGTP